MDRPDYSAMRVVLIDDEPVVLRSIELALKDNGVDVCAFSEPGKALSWIESNGADIVITDVRMPECDGFQVLKRVKELDSRCDVIFMTALGQLDIAIRALREGVTDFFEKPFTPEALCAALERTRRYQLLSRQKDILSGQVAMLSNEISGRSSQQQFMLGQSAAMKKIALDIADIARSNATILITGESGCGKELVAGAIHKASQRAGKPFLTVNCPSIPDDLFESEMFGHRRGAYTGAVETRGGYVEGASGGSLFLDEIGDLPLKSQAKILRLLEQKTYMPVGEQKERAADVRVIAATNQALEQMVQERKFREDLYYRLNVCSVCIPPLRERKDDIPLLALYFALNFASDMGKAIDGIEDDAIETLTAYAYPGNVRELRNIMESSIIRCRHDGKIRRDDLPGFMAHPPQTETAPSVSDSIRFEDVERNLYLEALKKAESNTSAAARTLGISRSKLRRRLAALGIDRTASTETAQ